MMVAMMSHSPQLLKLSDSHYPPLLREIADPPRCLYIIGNAECLQRPQIALVGSRNPTAGGRELAKELAADLVAAGFVITSGLALGIDGASHQGTLEAHGETIAVLGNGFPQIYPRQHQRLADTIVANGGAVITELTPGKPPLPHHFPQRNRIISGLSLATVVVEARPKSGSLITARLAAEQNRDVFAVPGSPRNPLTTGCHQLIQQGAKLITGVDDILNELPSWSKTIHKAAAPAPGGVYQGLADDERKLVECIGFEVTTIDQLIARTSFSAARVASLLLNIELHGYIRTIPNGIMRVR